jgi:hypothetical protein
LVWFFLYFYCDQAFVWITPIYLQIIL